MNPYRGQLKGGPDDGNFIDSTVPYVITYHFTILNQYGNDAEPSIMLTHGAYSWIEKDCHYVWRLISSRAFTVTEFTKWVNHKYESPLNPDTQPQTGASQTPDSPTG